MDGLRGLEGGLRLRGCTASTLGADLARSSDNNWEDVMTVWTWRSLQAIAAGSAALALTAPAQAQQSPGNWVMKAPVPAALSEVGVAYAGGKIHVIGGSVLGFTGPYHVEYDPATDKWRVRQPLPRALDHIGTTVLNNKIYALGGFVGGATHKDGQPTAFEYDPVLDTWRTLASMKVGRGSVDAIALDGKVHAIAGRDPAGTTLTLHEVYDPATNTWTEAAPLPKARDHSAVAVIDGKIHVAGGRLGASTDRVGQHDIYDSKTNSWSSGPPLPTARSGLAGVVYKGLFLVLGGEMPPSTTNAENEAYDVKTDTWVKLAPMPGGRHATGAATDGEHVYVAAGSLTPGGAGATNQLIVFTLP
jgi:N-acetylneuraminic acid mutarotase